MLERVDNLKVIALVRNPCGRLPGNSRRRRIPSTQSYESVTLRAVAELRILFAFCGIRFDAGTEAFVRRSQSEHQDNEYADFKRPETADRWRRELRQDIRDAILADLRDIGLESFAQ